VITNNGFVLYPPALGRFWGGQKWSMKNGSNCDKMPVNTGVWEGVLKAAAMEIGLRGTISKSEFRPRLPGLGRFGEGEKRGWKHVDAERVLAFGFADGEVFCVKSYDRPLDKPHF
jgi:hypothetical protein